MPEEIADRLYTEPPERFVTAREQAAAQAREAGEPATAQQIRKLRRPTIAGWLVNLLAIRRPDRISELTELAAALRTAQRELRGAELRELSAQRRTLVASLVGQVRELAIEADPRMDPNRLPLGDVETTLNAALSDTEVAAAVTSGRLLRAVAYAGFGEIPRPQLRLLTGGAARTGPNRAADPGGGGVAGQPGGGGAGEPGGAAQPGGAGEPGEAQQPTVGRAALRRELASARTEQKRAERDVERAAAAEHDGARVVAGIEAQLAELERRRSAAEQELGRLKLARKTAERAAVAARRRFGEAQAAIEHAGDDVPDRAAPSARADRKGLRQAQSGG